MVERNAVPSTSFRFKKASPRSACVRGDRGRCTCIQVGMVTKQNSSGGMEKLSSITKAGNRYLRQMLVVGVMAVVHYAERNGSRRPWLEVDSPANNKVAAVA